MSSVKNLNNFPFAAIIGQEEMKLALQLNVIDPKIGGVMIMGDRGTGKSTIFKKVQKDNDETHRINCFCFNANLQIKADMELG